MDNIERKGCVKKNWMNKKKQDKTLKYKRTEEWWKNISMDKL